MNSVIGVKRSSGERLKTLKIGHSLRSKISIDNMKKFAQRFSYIEVGDL